MFFLLTFDTEDEKEKFSKLYRKYAEFMLRVARRALHGSADAEDVVQDAFLYIADNLEKINLSDRKKTASYLALITEHKALDHQRRLHTELPLEEQLQLQEQTLMAETVWEEGEELARALLQLSPEQRTIVMLKWYYSYSFREIAALLDQTVNAVAGKAYRARKRLTHILERVE